MKGVQEWIVSVQDLVKRKNIKVDIDFETSENVVTKITETDGTPVTTTGVITWDEGSNEGE